MLSGVGLFLLSVYILFCAPGQALLRRSGSGVPLPFARVLASAIVSTFVGTSLAALGYFALVPLLLCNAAVATVAYIVSWRRPVCGNPPALRSFATSGLLLAVLALGAYWPAYPAFIGASDSTVYLASGVSIAHHGAVWLDDELGPTLPRPMREVLFDTMSQVLFQSGPPYRRMPGGIFLESLDSSTAWPCFFPVPSVWAAIFVVAGVPGLPNLEAAAPGYAPVFAALALWAFWVLARPWLGNVFALAATLLLGASAPFYTAAKMSLSEGIAAFFVLGGLAVVVNAGSRMRRSDAILAGAALGTAIFVRIEIALLLALALALLPSLRKSVPSEVDSRPAFQLPAAFIISALVVGSAVFALVFQVPGTYVAPLVDHLQNARLRYIFRFGYPTALQVAGVLATAVTATGLCARVVGWSATIRWGFVGGVVVGHAAAASFLFDRTPMWLSFYIGWPGLALAAAGAVLAWKDRGRLSAAPLILGLVAGPALILFYNPHVYPTIPWGARRYVPVLLPMLILLGCYACRRAASRSRLLSVAGIGVLAFYVAAGGRPIWGQAFMAGAQEQLQNVSNAIPSDGTILIDHDLSPMMIGPALWLVHNRNAVPVPSTNSNTGYHYLPKLVGFFAPKGPVYFVTRAIGSQSRVPFVKMERLGQAMTNLRLIEQTYDRRPEKTQRYMMPVAVYRLRRDPDPLGAPIP